MRHRIYAVLAAALLVVPSSLAAQDHLPSPLSDQNPFRLLNAPTTATWGGTQVGPYFGTVALPTLAQITLYCADYTHEINLGAAWWANVTNLEPATSDADLTKTRQYLVDLTDPMDALTTYHEAAYLASLFSSWSSYIGTYGSYTYASKADVYSGIAAAIWTLTGGFPPATTWATQANNMSAYFLGLAAGANTDRYWSNHYGEWSVVTPIMDPQDPHWVADKADYQEFLVHTTVTPEPETYALLLTGLLMILGVTWVRRRRTTESSIPV